MPAALLYHGFGISNIEYLRTRYTNGEITFDVCHKYKRCKHCKSSRVIQRGDKFRKVRTMPIGFKAVFMNITVRRFTCKACGHFGFEDVSHLVKPRKSYTNKLAHFIGELSHSMTISDISKHFGLHWNTVFEIVKARLKRSVPKVTDLRELSCIGVDEIAIKKRHTYMTIISDHETGRVVYAKEGRSLGLGLVAATQQPSALDSKLTSQVNVLVCHGLQLASDVTAVRERILNDMADEIYLDDELIKQTEKLTTVLRNLNRGEALISSSAVNRTFFLQVRPRISAHGGAPAEIK